MDQSNAAWEQDPASPTDKRHKRISYRITGYINNYEGTDDYNWQARRGDGCLSGIVIGAESAMAHADAALTLPVEEFNERAAANLREEMADLEKRILNLMPHADLLPGYHAGYEAGLAAMKAKIEAALS